MSARTWTVGTLLLALAAGAPAAETSLRFGRFGTVQVYRPAAPLQRVILFISGDGGWNLGVVDMARELAGTGALVVGVDIVSYLKALVASTEACVYPAADFEALSQFVQRRLDLPSYRRPLLVGYSSGATLVYAVLAQAPHGTFDGALGLGFCPDFPRTRPFCRGAGLASEPRPDKKGINFLPAATMDAPFVALQGTVDQVCDPEATAAFVKRLPHGEVVVLPKVGHGFSVPRNWMPQFKDAVAGMAAVPAREAATPPPAEALGTDVSAADATVDGLPLVEVPPTGTPARAMAVIVSGDGGWAGIDREVGEELARHGLPVVGLDSLKYFWKRKDPDVAGTDLARILRHYLTAWRVDRAALIGYSRGAEVLPFMVNRLPAGLRSRVAVVALLGPTGSVEFEFHVADWVRGPGGGNELPVLPEIQRLSGLQVVCFYGDEEKDSICPALPATLASVVAMRGAHHFGGAYRSIADAILERVRANGRPAH